MTFLNRFKYPALAVIVLVFALASCEKDPTTIGSGVVGGVPFNTDKAVFDVFAFNKKIEAVRTNQLPVYQLGIFNHAIYGKTEATVTSQVLLSTPNPVFGSLTQQLEDTEDDSKPAQIPENETIDSVYLYIPFLTSPMGDTDLDGLIDAQDVDPLDPNSDSDNDGLTDNQENTKGTDPLRPDTDGDGVGDADDDDFVQNQFAKTLDLDSIYVGNKLYDNTSPASFNLKLQRSDFFLRDLDPTTNFREAQEYFSNQRFESFLDSVLLDSVVSVSAMQIPLRKRDDESTEEVNEAEQFDYLAPGIRIALDTGFFQRNIIDKEGSSELLNQTNFNNFLRGIHFSITPVTDDVMFLFDLKRANITISYRYDSADTAGVVTEGENKRDFVLNFIQQPRNSQGQVSGAVQGNAVNTYSNDDFPAEINDNLDTGENASKIYLKGGSGAYAEINLFDEENGREAIEQIKANNWIINEANLVFYVDKNEAIIDPPRLYLYNTENDLPLIGPSDSFDEASSLNSYPFYGGLLEEADGSLRYTVKITDHINDLVVRNATNATLGLTVTSDIRQVNVSNAMLKSGTEQNLPIYSSVTPLGTVLFGSNVGAENINRKLQLEIFYTEAN